MEEKRIVRFQDLSLSLKAIVIFVTFKLVFFVAIMLVTILLIIFGIE